MFFSCLVKRAAAGALIIFSTAPALAQSPTRTWLVTQSPSPIGQPVAMTAQVDAFGGDAPRGSVAFSDGAANLGSAPIEPLGAGQATLAAGGAHTCALTSNGGVKCWGGNSYGSLGDGTTTSRSTPGWVTSLTGGIVAVTAGGGHSCALFHIGAVKCWGANSFAQLGDGTRQDRTTPATVDGLASGVVAIAAGGRHTCALIAAGRVLCWGSNSSGQLGTGDTGDRVSPTAVDDPWTIYRAVSAGDDHSCGLTSAGAVKCWGQNVYGQIGDGTDHNIRLRPVSTFGLSSGVTAVMAGGVSSCALTTAGALKCWGFNQDGEVGNGSSQIFISKPQQVYGLASGVVAASAGYEHSCALLNSGAVRCWGLNYAGEVGDGAVTQRRVPVTVSNLGGYAVAVVAGLRHHSCALLSPGRILRCWGQNDLGGLGDGTTVDRHLPRSVVDFWGLLRGRARLARTLAAGVHPLQARYLGDADHATSTSAIVQHKVQ